MMTIDRPRYRTQKGEVDTSVLGVCDTKRDYVFVLAGWEGFAIDSCILKDVISRSNDLKVSKGSQETYFLSPLF